MEVTLDGTNPLITININTLVTDDICVSDTDSD